MCNASTMRSFLYLLIARASSAAMSMGFAPVIPVDDLMVRAGRTQREHVRAVPVWSVEHAERVAPRRRRASVMRGLSGQARRWWQPGVWSACRTAL